MILFWKYSPNVYNKVTIVFVFWKTFLNKVKYLNVHELKLFKKAMRIKPFSLRHRDYCSVLDAGYLHTNPLWPSQLLWQDTVPNSLAIHYSFANLMAKFQNRPPSYLHWGEEKE